MSSVFGAVSGLAMQEETHLVGSHHPFVESLITDGDQTPFFRDPGIFDEQSLVNLIGDGMATNIIRDPRNTGVIFDPYERKFIRKETIHSGTHVFDHVFSSFHEMFGSTVAVLYETCVVWFRSLAWSVRNSWKFNSDR